MIIDTLSFLKKRTALAVRLLFLTAAALSCVASPAYSQQTKAEQPLQNTESDQPIEPQTTSPETKDPVTAEATETAARSGIMWLERLSSTIRNANFEVSFVVTRPGQEVVPYLWRHAVLDDGTEAEQLNLQNGPGQEMIRLGNMVSVFEPDVQPYSIYADAIAGPLPSDLIYDPNSLTKGYQLITTGRTRVSGRAAQQVRIVSRDNSRYNFQLWLDEETGMLLKLNMVDLQGKLLEQVQVTGLTMQSEPAAYFAKINRSALPSAARIYPKSRKHQWEVQYLPVGMQEVKRETRRLAITGQVVEYKLFSDGLVDVSVYVQPAKDSLDSDVVLVNSTNTFLSLTNGQVQITVIGKIPPPTANEIAHSIRSVGS